MLINNKDVAAAASDLDLKLCFDEEIKPGDMYIALRNTGPRLLTCLKVCDGYILNVEHEYPYDIHECVKVIEK